MACCEFMSNIDYVYQCCVLLVLQTVAESNLVAAVLPNHLQYTAPIAQQNPAGTEFVDFRNVCVLLVNRSPYAIVVVVICSRIADLCWPAVIPIHHLVLLLMVLHDNSPELRDDTVISRFSNRRIGEEVGIQDVCEHISQLRVCLDERRDNSGHALSGRVGR
jgi:hypothetical protein